MVSSDKGGVIINYHNIVHDDMRNGDGLRVTLFVSGCDHFCKNCQNPQTWDYSSGVLFDTAAHDEIMFALSHDHIEGLTISGGDPLYWRNVEDVNILLNHVRREFPHKTVWVYTGYTFENVRHLAVMQKIDVLVDGEFEEDLADVNYQWAGSTNQRVIDVQKSLREGKVVLKND